MTNKLYKLMDWAAIEAITYAEEDNPHGLLGPHPATGGKLVQMFYPEGETAVLHTKAKDYPMELADEDGFFAVLVPKSTDMTDYSYTVTTASGKEISFYDPYGYEPIISQKDGDKFNAGNHYEIYDLLGAHPYEVDGRKGVLFALWAPNAMRVSVVGDFNHWDGRVHPMRRLYDSGIFELFIPMANVGDHYKFEIKAKGGRTFLKADPYAVYSQKAPETASIVYKQEPYAWTDGAWMKEKAKRDTHKEAMSIYEVCLSAFVETDAAADATATPIKKYKNYRDIAPILADHILALGYTHVELLPVMEHSDDASCGYQVTGYFAPTSRYGTPEDFCYLIDYLHGKGIGVILDWVPAHFSKEAHGLAGFDGTCLYEHADPRQGYRPGWDMMIYNYGRPEVRNFLLANALYWAKEYHVDGLRVDAVAPMLYLDYGKKPGDWVANMYGGNENLEAIEFLKELNTQMKKQCPGTIMIAEDSSVWPNVTGASVKDSLGFDYKWDIAWRKDVMDYMGADPLFRASKHQDLTLSMVYAYGEHFILPLGHDAVMSAGTSLYGAMPGDDTDRFANLRAAYAYMMFHPGKKLFFMGQDLGDTESFVPGTPRDATLAEKEEHKQLAAYVKALHDLYKNQAALYAMDDDPAGFSWVSSMAAEDNTLVFRRLTGKEKESILVVCNFSGKEHKDYGVGVPLEGKYKELFNSDEKAYGGSGYRNVRAIPSKEEPLDGQDHSIRVKLPALSVVAFTYTPFTAKEKAEIEKQKEIERKRRIEEEKKQKALAEESEAKRMAKEAKAAAEEADRVAKEALKRAMEAAQYALDMEKKAKACEEKRLTLEKSTLPTT